MQFVSRDLARLAAEFEHHAHIQANLCSPRCQSLPLSVSGSNAGSARGKTRCSERWLSVPKSMKVKARQSRARQVPGRALAGPQAATWLKSGAAGTATQLQRADSLLITTVAPYGSALQQFTKTSWSGIICSVRQHRRSLPNPSVERTRSGRPRLASISFWAKRNLPLRSAHLKR